MKYKSKIKEEFPTLEDLMFRNDTAIKRAKRKKYYSKTNRWQRKLAIKK